MTSLERLLINLDGVAVYLDEDGAPTLADSVREAMTRLQDGEGKGVWHMISPAGIYECSGCGQMVMTDDIDCYKRCHNCGRRMAVDA